MNVRPTLGQATAVLLLGGALGGCGGPPPAASTVPPLQPVTTFDGLYRGALRLSGMGGQGGATENVWCVTPANVSIRVVNSQFGLSIPHPNVPGNPTPVFAVYVTPNGRFEGQSDDGGNTISGQVGAGRLQANINGAGCQYTLTAYGLTARSG